MLHASLHAPTGLQPWRCKRLGHNAQTLPKKVHMNLHGQHSRFDLSLVAEAQVNWLTRLAVECEDVNPDVRRRNGYQSRSEARAFDYCYLKGARPTNSKSPWALLQHTVRTLQHP
jgi:hypothetical protein